MEIMYSFSKTAFNEAVKFCCSNYKIQNLSDEMVFPDKQDVEKHLLEIIKEMGTTINAGSIHYLAITVTKLIIDKGHIQVCISVDPSFLIREAWNLEPDYIEKIISIPDDSDLAKFYQEF